MARGGLVGPQRPPNDAQSGTTGAISSYLGAICEPFRGKVLPRRPSGPLDPIEHGLSMFSVFVYRARYSRAPRPCGKLTCWESSPSLESFRP